LQRKKANFLATKRLLLIDKDEFLQSSLREQFQRDDEFVFEAVSTAQKGLVKAQSFRPHLFLVGISAQDTNSIQFVRRLHDCYPIIPLILLISEDGDPIPSFDGKLSVERSFIKPFKLSMLLNDIRSLVLEDSHGAAGGLLIGPYTFFPNRNLMADGELGRRIRLTEKEGAILVCLFENKEKFVSRRRLLAEVWGYERTATTHTVETHIYRLRQKIERDPSHAEILRTEPGGYRLTP